MKKSISIMISNKKNNTIQEKYENIYSKVENEMKQLGFIKESLMELCSTYLERKGNENQINIEFLLGSSLDMKKSLKNAFDLNAKELGFEMNYVNLSGSL